MSEEESNLCSSILRDTSKKSRNFDSKCVLLGERSLNKLRVIEKFSSNFSINNTDEDGENTNFIEGFNYFNVEDGLPDHEVGSRVHIWALSNRFFENAVDIFLKPDCSDPLSFLISLDLTAGPAFAIDSLERSLAQIKKFTQSFDSVVFNERNIQLQSYLDGARSSQSDSLESEDRGGVKAQVDLSFNFGVPVLVVVFIPESHNLDDISTVQSLREFQGQLRARCVLFGASIQFFPASADDSNYILLKKYLLHRLYPDSISMCLKIEDSVDRCFIPGGFDSKELISISTGVGESTLDLGNVRFEFETRYPPGGILPNVETSRVDMESEDDWLTGLQEYIKLASEASLSGATEKAIPAPPTAIPQSLSGDALSAMSGAASRSRKPLVTASNSSTADTSSASSTTADAPALSAAPKLPRRGSVAPVSKSDQDVNSFFQSLLVSNPPAANTSTKK